MAKDETPKAEEPIPTGTKALTKMVEDLRTQVAQEQAGRAADAHAHEQAIQTLHEAHEHAVSLMAQDVADARDIAARAMDSASAMSGNRDTWVGRADKARRLVADALAALDGLDSEPEASTEGETEEPIPLPPAPDPDEAEPEG
jgi:hypothetical protein